MNIRHYLPKVIAITAIAVLAAANSCFGTVLSVTQRNQEKQNWCWDASAQMVLEYFGKSVSQTDIAQWAVGGKDIANYLYGSSDSSMHGCDEILSHYASISSKGLAYAMSLSTLASEISAGRPPILRWGWNSGGGHIAVIHGVEGSTVYVRDPWPANGPQVQSYDWVCKPYGNSGTWTHTLQLTSGSAPDNQYYTYYKQYMSYANYYLQRYNSTGSYMDLYYTYYYYAYAGAYYYLSKGQNSTAVQHYYYYLSYANQVLATAYYNAYAHSGSHKYAAYCCYYYAYTYWYYYMYAGNSSYANYYYKYYMYYANWYSTH